MNTMKWLIKRELWENKGMLFWAPVVMACVLLAIALAALIAGHNMQYDGNHIGMVVIAGKPLEAFGAGAAKVYLAAGMPVLMMLGFLVFFYCLGALHDERRDRSLLFWKSLPVSDAMTVLSKAATALVVAPLIVFGIIIVLSLLMLALTCIGLMVHGTNAFGAVLSQADFYVSPLRLLGLLPVYLLCALPTVGWLLLVSSWARSKVFLWAVGVPLAIGLLILWSQRALGLDIDGTWFLSTITTRALLGVVPGAWFLFEKIARAGILASAEHVDGGSIFSASWAALGSVSLWVGAAAGVAMIAAATWLRRWREEN